MKIKKQDKKQVKQLLVETLSEREMASVSGGGVIVNAFDGMVLVTDPLAQLQGARKEFSPFLKV